MIFPLSLSTYCTLEVSLKNVCFEGTLATVHSQSRHYDEVNNTTLSDVRGVSILSVRSLSLQQNNKEKK